MWRFVVAALIASCQFTPGAAPNQSGDGGGTGDAPGDTGATSGAPIVDAVQTTSGASVSTLSWTHAATGNHRLVVVGVSWGLNPAVTINSITYGLQSMTVIGTQNNTIKNIQMALWKLVAPPTGLQTITVTFSSTVGENAIAGSISFTGVDQTTPTGTFVSTTGGGNTISLAIASGPNELVMDTVAADSNPSTMTAGTGQNQQWNVHPGRWGGASTKAGAASVMMGWTEGGSSDDWAEGAVSIKGG